MSHTITFIGAGNMTRSLITGLCKRTRNQTPTKNGAAPYIIRIADPVTDQLKAILQDCPQVEPFTDNMAAIEGADMVVMAVKPQLMQAVCEPLQAAVQKHQPVIVSIAAGITIANLQNWLASQNLAVVRCMPNTPALVQSGMTGLFANAQVSQQQANMAESILRTVGGTLWVKQEPDLDAVTAVSGSGPAYYFLVMEAMQNAAEALGLSTEDARSLVLQTAFGAAKLALESNDDPVTLRQRVSSKGGTTEAAINKLLTGGLPELFAEAMEAAAQRSKELSKL